MAVTRNILLTVSKFPKGATFTSKLLPLLLKLKLTLILACLLLPQGNVIFSQTNDLSISVKGNYTSTSRYYPSSVGIGSYSYEQYHSIDDLFGYGLELRYFLTDNILTGLSIERISGTTGYRHPSLSIPVKSGYNMYIVEANGYYNIPLSGESFKFYIGGGISLAKGNGYEELPSLRSDLISSPVNIGIQALSGLEYFFKKNISVRWEMKFRDPIVENESKYNSSKINYMGRIINVSTKPFKSKINIDGIVFDLSIAYHLF